MDVEEDLGASHLTGFDAIVAKANKILQPDAAANGARFAVKQAGV